MGYNELLKKNYHFDDNKFANYIKFNGGIKKKHKDVGITNLFQQSTIKFFCFHLKGKLLCYYDDKPVGSSII
jgi:hypothetical protein